MRKLYIEELRDLYNAEKQILKALPKMTKAATSPDLKAAFESHLEETKGQVGRLEKIFEELGKSPKGKTCKAMEGLVEYYRSTAGEHPDWDDYRAAMAREQRVLVRITPERAGPDRSG